MLKKTVQNSYYRVSVCSICSVPLKSLTVPRPPQSPDGGIVSITLNSNINNLVIDPNSPGLEAFAVSVPTPRINRCCLTVRRAYFQFHGNELMEDPNAPRQRRRRPVDEHNATVWNVEDEVEEDALDEIIEESLAEQQSVCRLM